MNTLTNTVLENSVANNNSDGFLIGGTVSQDSIFKGNSASGNAYNGLNLDGVLKGNFVKNYASENGSGIVWASKARAERSPTILHQGTPVLDSQWTASPMPPWSIMLRMAIVTDS